MYKNHVRIHKQCGNKVASVYIDEVYLNKPLKVNTRSNITTTYYDCLGICVSKDKRLNNDWWAGDKRSFKLDNKCTGDIKTILAIQDAIYTRVEDFRKEYGFYCCLFEATDDKRKDTYDKMFKRYVKRHDEVDWYKTTYEDGAILYYIA